MIEMYVRLILEAGWKFSRVPLQHQKDVKTELTLRGYDENENLMTQ